MQYKLYAAPIATGNASASVKVTKKIKLRGLNFCISALSGAATTGWMVFEISKQNTDSRAVNDAPVTVLGYASIALNIASSGFATNQFVACSADLDVGDTIYMNTTLSGQAPSATSVAVTLCD